MDDLEQLLNKRQRQMRQHVSVSERVREWWDGVDLIEWSLNAAMRVMMPVLGLMALGLLIALPFIVVAEFKRADHDAKIKEECLADGRKEYECVAMLRRGGGQMVPMPIPMPMVVR